MLLCVQGIIVQDSVNTFPNTSYALYKPRKYVTTLPNGICLMGNVKIICIVKFGRKKMMR